MEKKNSSMGAGFSTILWGVLAVLVVALMGSGCAGLMKPRIHRVAEDVFFVEVEEFTLTNAKVQELDNASGGKVVVLQDDTSRAEATVQLSKGNYQVTVYALGPSSEEDAFYLTAGEQWEERLWPTWTGEILPAPDVSLTQQADGPCKIVIRFAEPNVQLDRVEFKRVP